MSSGKIGIVGTGLIGRSWSMIFLAYGYDVHLYDVSEDILDKAIEMLKKQIEKLEQEHILRGRLSAQQQINHIHKASTLKECIDGAILVQECIFENLELKQKLFADIDQICSNDVVICSSTSCFLPSLLFKGLKHCSQMIVGHPVNPPYFVPLIEIVPSEWTDPMVAQKTRDIYEKVGQKPVLLKKEIPGFIVNRVQYAILNECYRLINDDVISVTDVERVMAFGLGMRYSFMGPWETAHLNANGLKEYFEKYAQGIYDVSMTFGPVPKMEGSTAELISSVMNEAIPLDKLPERRKWRDERLTELSMLKRKSEE